MGNITNVSSQVASTCCSEKSAVYIDESRGSWKSPFQGVAEFANVSNMMSQSSSQPMKRDVPSVVLLGGTGVGKSNLGNYVLGRVAFESRMSQDSVTSATSWVDGMWFGGRHPVRVVDCAGIGDTKGAGADQQQWDRTIDVLRQVGRINALVMVMRAGRFTKFDKEVVSVLRESFGACFWKNLCVFYTGASAKPGQLNLDVEGPKIRRKLHQIEKEQGGDASALRAIDNMHVYGADLDPVLACPKRRSGEFKFKPALGDLGLEELLTLDLRIPPNVMDMSSDEFRRFSASDPAVERWIEGNYFQLGLSRLAAFKMDVLAMEPFEPGKLERLADAPEDEKPPEAEDENSGQPGMAGAAVALEAATAPWASDADAKARDIAELESLESAIGSREVVLIKGSWLLEMGQHGTPLPRRQDLPGEASWDAAELMKRLHGMWAGMAPPLVAISYAWLTEGHPDPQCFHLRQLGPLLTAYARWNRTSPDNLAVFVDWCSLMQSPRTNEEAALYERALQRIHIWFAHARVSKWCLSRTPEGSTPYKDRGWPHFEKAVTSLGGPDYEPMLDLGLARPNWASWGQILQDCRLKLTPPAAPDMFAVDLAGKVFSDAIDRERVIRLYAEAFSHNIGSAICLGYGGLHWGDREAIRISKVLPLCTALRELDLQQNDIGRRGAAALSGTLVRCPQLERLSLWGNCLDAEARELLAKEWLQARKPESGLDIAEQRRSTNPLEVLTQLRSKSNDTVPSPTSPAHTSPKSALSRDRTTLSVNSGSPTKSGRRSSEDMTALQMAELGARQAAFEARLHVAINKIASTLTEVGDKVAMPSTSGSISPSPSMKASQGGRA
mmetsp:Transcript_22794/g.65717  ORF Transcript_22794/g.65717 Transcript_22794/m.65717 type:complete len:840 (+) Transcript_22794:97-2616(+)